MPRYDESTMLIEACEDMFGRTQKMTPHTQSCWLRMCEAAAADGIDLKLVSAFRSIDYQCELIRQKLNDGRTIDDILSVNAIPGHSEHHTGCALDLHSGEGIPLEEDFEHSSAFSWLQENAADFNFYLSYPRGNPEGIAFEPWHWCCRAKDEDS